LGSFNFYARPKKLKGVYVVLSLSSCREKAMWRYILVLDDSALA